MPTSYMALPDIQAEDPWGNVARDEAASVPLSHRLLKRATNILSPKASVVEFFQATNIKAPPHDSSDINDNAKHPRRPSDANLKESLKVYTRSLRRSHSQSSSMSTSSRVTHELEARDHGGNEGLEGQDVTPEPGSLDTETEVPLLLQRGTLMIKVSVKKMKALVFSLDADRGSINWESKKSGQIFIENIKEIRTGDSTRPFRLQFKLASMYEPRWLTIIYTIPTAPLSFPSSTPGVSSTSSSSASASFSSSISSGTVYKILHMVALTSETFDMWVRTLHRLHDVRKQLMTGLGRVEERERLWERGVWRSADISSLPVPAYGSSSGVKELNGVKAKILGKYSGTAGSAPGDERLKFGEVERMCRRLGVSLSRSDLEGLFKIADTENKGYLDFPSFRRFVKMLKVRPELVRLYKKLCAFSSSPISAPATRESTEEKATIAGQFDYAAFERFMRETQKSKISKEEMERLWTRFANPIVEKQRDEIFGTGGEPQDDEAHRSSTPIDASYEVPTPVSTPDSISPSQGDPYPNSDTPSTQKHLTMSLARFTTFLLSSANAVDGEPPPSTHSPALPMSLASSSISQSVSPEESLPDSESQGLTTPTSQTTHDMTRPLSEYYISSSHNTYLIGRQLVGVSTIEGYVRALLGGCRSVELDIYDSDSEPVITHGKTLTSSVTLRDACTAIAKYAFVASPYPIIISAEVHCGVIGQDNIAKIMKEIFGDSLVRTELVDGELVIAGMNHSQPVHPGMGRANVTGNNTAIGAGVTTVGSAIDVDVLPSPEELKGRVLLKAKNLYVSESKGLAPKSVTVDAESSVTTTTTQSESDGEAFKELKNDFKSEFAKARNMVKRLKAKSVSGDSQSGDGTGNLSSNHYEPNRNSTSQKQKVKMSLALVALLVYTVGVKCRGLNKKETYAPNHVFSLSERTANKVLKQSMYDLIKHNRTHVVRVYPHGMRIGSTNFEPIKYWGAGCQMVALNWQTFDVGYMINHAMFQRNGKAGYVLKPAALRSNDKSLLMKRSKHLLRVTVISGQQLPCPSYKLESSASASVVDPFVEVSLHLPDWSQLASSLFPTAPTSPPTSPSSPSRSISYRTSVVKNNGFNPIWEETLVLPFDVAGDMKDLVFVRFEVKDKDGSDGCIGVYCVSLACLREGYRHIPLHDSQLSQYLFSTLFVKVEIEDVTAFY